MPLNETDYLRRSRYLTGPLAAFDCLLGTVALFFPHFYFRLFQPSAENDPVYLLMRTGTLWLGFCFVESLAFVFYRRVPELLLMVSVLRLNDVPADLVYCFADQRLGDFGRFALLFAPAFNTTAGSLLLYMYWRYRRQVVAPAVESASVATGSPT